jgi:hypothetical protein
VVVGHQKIIPDLQLFHQHEGHNGHLQYEGEDQHLMAEPEIGQGPKGEIVGMVRL